MTDETMDWERMSPQEKLASPRGRYLIAEALHYGARQIMRFPEVCRADRDCEDMLEMLNGCFPHWDDQFRANDRKWEQMYKPSVVDDGFRPLGRVDDED